MAAAAILKARQAAGATSYRGALIIRVLASITFRALVRPVTQACHGRTTYSKPPAAWSARGLLLCLAAFGASPCDAPPCGGCCRERKGTVVHSHVSARF